MIKKIGFLFAFLFEFKIDFAEAKSAWQCGYDKDPGECASYDFLYYADIASKTGITLMVFIIILIGIHIIKEVYTAKIC